MDVRCLTQWTLHSQICSTFSACVSVFELAHLWVTFKILSHLFSPPGSPVCSLLCCWFPCWLWYIIIYMCLVWAFFFFSLSTYCFSGSAQCSKRILFSLCLLLYFAPKVPLNHKKNLKQRSVSVDREAADDGNLEEPLKLRRPKEHVEGKTAVASRTDNLYIRAFL